MGISTTVFDELSVIQRVANSGFVAYRDDKKIRVYAASPSAPSASSPTVPRQDV